MAKIAVIRVRGKIGIPSAVSETLDRLHLHRQNFCTIVEDTPSTMGMITKVKDFVTWGPVDEATITELKKLEEKDVRKDAPKKFFRLKPPKKGYASKGIKKHFNVGGALGSRGDKMGELIKRMV